jgi:UDP-N-acetylglucosamine pyrophosphorylase
MKRHLAVVIMAAGKGTRMKNPDVAKVMFEVNDRPMVEHVVDLALKLQSDRTIVIVGWKKETVTEHLHATGKPVLCVEQSPQLGTGHAVMQAEQPLRGFEGDVLVLSGDVPLLSYETMLKLIAHHRVTRATATVLTAELDDPTGYGRIVRGAEGDVHAIVEHKDATEEQRAIREINSGIYVFESSHLFDGLRHITPENVQHEYYLTDVFEYFWKSNLRVSAVTTHNPKEIQGVNTPEQLKEAQEILRVA